MSNRNLDGSMLTDSANMVELRKLVSMTDSDDLWEDAEMQDVLNYLTQK